MDLFTTIGPVIGEVTSNSSRILIECNKDCTIKCRITSYTQVISIDLNLKALV